MKVYVVMSNDYPDCVFKQEDKAETYVDERNKATENQLGHSARRIYWRVYGFQLK